MGIGFESSLLFTKGCDAWFCLTALGFVGQIGAGSRKPGLESVRLSIIGVLRDWSCCDVVHDLSAREAP